MKTSTKLIIAGTATIVAAGAIFGTVQIASAFNQLAAPVKHSVALGTPTPTATATKAPVAPSITDGAVLTTAQANDIQNGTSTSGMIAYQATNGQFLAVNPNQPVPAPVMQDIQARANAVPALTGGTAQDVVTNAGAAIDLQNTIQLGTGRPVVLITYGSFGTRTGMILGYLAQGTRDSNNAAYVGTNLATVEAEANAYVAKQADPSNWIVVVRQR